MLGPIGIDAWEEENYTANYDPGTMSICDDWTGLS